MPGPGSRTRETRDTILGDDGNNPRSRTRETWGTPHTMLGDDDNNPRSRTRETWGTPHTYLVMTTIPGLERRETRGTHYVGKLVGSIDFSFGTLH